MAYSQVSLPALLRQIGSCSNKPPCWMHQMHSRLISLYSVSLSFFLLIQRNESHPCSGTRGYLTLQILQIPLPTDPFASLCSRRQLPYVLHGPAVSTFPGLPKKWVTVSLNYPCNHPEGLDHSWLDEIKIQSCKFALLGVWNILRGFVQREKTTTTTKKKSMQLKWQHIAEDGFSLYPSGLGAQQSSAVPLCYLCPWCSKSPDHPRYREKWP